MKTLKLIVEVTNTAEILVRDCSFAQIYQMMRPFDLVMEERHKAWHRSAAAVLILPACSLALKV